MRQSSTQEALVNVLSLLSGYSRNLHMKVIFNFHTPFHTRTPHCLTRPQAVRVTRPRHHHPPPPHGVSHEPEPHMQPSRREMALAVKPPRWVTRATAQARHGQLTRCGLRWYDLMRCHRNCCSTQPPSSLPSSTPPLPAPRRRALRLARAGTARGACLSTARSALFKLAPELKQLLHRKHILEVRERRVQQLGRGAIR